MICDTIRELRERAGVSQAALARRVGVTRSAVNAWEMGLSIPTTQYVAELAQFFRVSAQQFLCFPFAIQNGCLMLIGSQISNFF